MLGAEPVDGPSDGGDVKDGVELVVGPMVGLKD